MADDHGIEVEGWEKQTSSYKLRSSPYGKRGAMVVFSPAGMIQKKYTCESSEC